MVVLCILGYMFAISVVEYILDCIGLDVPIWVIALVLGILILCYFIYSTDKMEKLRKEAPEDAEIKRIMSKYNSSKSDDRYYPSFVDSSGQLRFKGDNFYDDDGCYRSPNESFVDSRGAWRSPGDEFYDWNGNSRRL